MPEPQYLGDGVYISSAGYLGAFRLTTGHHEESQADNVIVLEPEVICALVDYLKRNGFTP